MNSFSFILLIDVVNTCQLDIFKYHFFIVVNVSYEIKTLKIIKINYVTVQTDMIGQMTFTLDVVLINIYCNRTFTVHHFCIWSMDEKNKYIGGQYD